MESLDSAASAADVFACPGLMVPESARSSGALPAPSGAADPASLAFDPVAVEPRRAGWTPQRQRQFIEALADCGIVREAAARVGITEQSAYRLRRRPGAAGFNRAWDAAVRLGVHRLHSAAFERAVAGTVRRRYFNGEVVGEDRVFDNRLLIYLLGRLDKQHDYHVTQTIEHWDGAMGALEDGLEQPLPAPDEGRQCPVWRDKNGGWATSFPPPDGFSGYQSGPYGEAGYRRRLSAEEREAMEVWEARRAAPAHRIRDRYFARLKEEF